MVVRLNHRLITGLKVRLLSALRCLTYRKYVLVVWEKCEDGELDFHITHKGISVHEAIHRLKVDAYEILENVEEQNCAIDVTRDLLK